jgi:TRAP-type C4-dicarboxylate transport system permease small subunit
LSLGGAAAARRLRRLMDALYLACVLVSGAALVLISLVIPYSVYTRYVLNRAASWPEPTAILLTIVLTFFGAAACYRSETHMRVDVLVRMLPGAWRRLAETVSEMLSAVLAVFMIVWGARLVEATWHQSIAEVPGLSVGLTYLPIPLGGAVVLLFVAERLLIGRPEAAAHPEAPRFD